MIAIMKECMDRVREAVPAVIEPLTTRNSVKNASLDAIHNYKLLLSGVERDLIQASKGKDVAEVSAAIAIVAGIRREIKTEAYYNVSKPEPAVTIERITHNCYRVADALEYLTNCLALEDNAGPSLFI